MNVISRSIMPQSRNRITPTIKDLIIKGDMIILKVLLFYKSKEVAP